MDEILKNIFSHVNEWVKYAEAKNAIILTLNGAGFFASLQVLNQQDNLPKYIYSSLWVFSFFMLLSITISILSFLPHLNIPKFIEFGKNRNISESDNLLFYGDISKYTPKSYLHNLYLKYNNEINEVYNNFELDYSNQIVINSKIAYRKFRMFKLSTYNTVIGCLAFIISIIIFGYSTLHL